MNARELINGLGGAEKVADRLGQVRNSLYCSIARDYISPRHHIKLWIMAHEVGFHWTPPGAEGYVLTKRRPPPG